ncbi:MAG: hypothetical protein ACAH83_09190 [Alphaproteobacteria bacterium]
MSTPEHQEKLKEEAKAISKRLETLIKDKDPKTRMVRTVCIYAGLITETLLEYEEPDVVMEQAFHRIADLLRTDPQDGTEPDSLLPLAYVIDHDTELGRQLGRGVAKKLPKGLDDIHEIAIALVINDFPLWEKQLAVGKDRLLRLLIETVIASLTYEMATQDFCDLLIEEFIADGNSASQGILALSAVAGHYLAIAEHKVPLPSDADKEFTNVMVRESLRHGTPGIKNWGMLAAANDTEGADIPEYLKQLKPQIEEFFVLIGLDDPLGRAVSIAKAVGRMVAVITVEDVGQIHPSIAKSLAKTGMILGAKYREEAKA